jgi:hypothetical protein
MKAKTYLGCTLYEWVVMGSIFLSILIVGLLVGAAE